MKTRGRDTVAKSFAVPGISPEQMPGYRRRPPWSVLSPGLRRASGRVAVATANASPLSCFGSGFRCATTRYAGGCKPSAGGGLQVALPVHRAPFQTHDGSAPPLQSFDAVLHGQRVQGLAQAGLRRWVSAGRKQRAHMRTRLAAGNRCAGSHLRRYSCLNRIACPPPGASFSAMLSFAVTLRSSRLNLKRLSPCQSAPSPSR